MVDNLEWCTREYNANYGTINTRKRDAERMPVCCLLKGTIIKRYEAIIDVEKDGHNPGHVSRCCNGIYKTHHGMSWSFIK